jgi:hypothetical protein
MSALRAPGTRMMSARQRSGETAATSMTYGRPAMDCSKRCTTLVTRVDATSFFCWGHHSRRRRAGFQAKAHTKARPMRLHRCFDRRLVEHVSWQHLRSRVVDPTCRRIADKRRDHTPSANAGRAGGPCRRRATMSMRVGFASGTRPGPPIEERKSCERGRLKAPPRREGKQDRSRCSRIGRPG